jgi:hypothetical protein
MTLNEFKELLKKVINTPELLAEMGLALEAIDGGAVTVTDLTVTGTATVAAADVTGNLTAGVVTSPQISGTNITGTTVVATGSLLVNGSGVLTGDLAVTDDITADGITVESIAFTGGTGTWSGDLNGGSGTLFRTEQLFIDSNLQHEGTFLGFYNVVPTTKPTVSGAKGGNAALTSLCSALATLGLITNSTT